MDVFPFILYRFFKILVGIGKTDNIFVDSFRFRTSLKSESYCFFLSLFFLPQKFSLSPDPLSRPLYKYIQGDKKQQKQPPEVLYEKSAIRNAAKFTGKHPYQSLFFNKVAGLRPATLVKKRLRRRCFPVNFAKFIRTPILKNICKQLLLKQEIIFVSFSEESQGGVQCFKKLEAANQKGYS